MLKLQRPWDSQPQEVVGLDYANPLANGLLFVYHAPSGSIIGPDLPLVGTTTRGPSSGGIALQIAGAGYAGSTVPNSLALPMTFGALAYTTSTAAAQTLVSAGNNANSDVYFQLGLNTGGTVRAASRISTYFSADTTNAVTVGRPFVAAAVYRSITSRYAFLNGVLSAENTSSSNPTINAFRLGTLARNTPADYLNGGILLAPVWGRALSEAELREWSDNPWQLFEPRRIWVPVSAGGAASHDATGAISADAATVSGTAAHYTLHASSGALEAQAAVIAGTATHLTLHTATGALAADAATVAGAAALTSTGSFTSIGDLSAGAATVAGTAAHYALHTATGVLVADPASVSGAAVDETTFVPPKNTGAGKSRKRRDRYEVEIDGEVFPAASVEEAHAILEQAKEQAKAVADQAVARAAKAKKREPRKVIADAEKALQLPDIKAPPELQGAADAAMADIQALYEQAAQAIEIEAAMRRREAEIEADDEDILLLL